MSASEVAAAWSRLHHGIDPRRAPLLNGWLRAMWWLARPLALLRVPPLALTVLGALLALDALLLVAALPAVALVAVLAAVLCDGLDGAIAVLAGRATRLGSVADKVADRIADSAFALVIWRCGAPLWLAGLAGGLSLAHEGMREVLRGGRLVRITVAERPTRAICTLLACMCAAVTPAVWPATLCAAVWAALAVIALAQLAPGGGQGRPPRGSAGPSSAPGPAPRTSAR